MGLNPDTLTDTVSFVEFVVPPPGLTASQFPPDEVETPMEYASDEIVLVIARPWLPGGLESCWNEKLNDGGFAESIGAAGVTFSVTGTLIGLFFAWLAVTLTLPLYVPAPSPARTTESMETVSIDGVEPPPETFSQFPPEVVEAEALTLTTDPLLLMVVVLEAGSEPLIW